jgi:hypothetical protein
MHVCGYVYQWIRQRYKPPVDWIDMAMQPTLVVVAQWRWGYPPDKHVKTM